MQTKKEGGLGFLKFEDMNLALLAKLGWKLATKENLAWVDILLKKYRRGEKFLEAKVKNYHSRLWKDLCETRDLLRNNSCYLIGQGDEVDIFGDRWVYLGKEVQDLSLMGPIGYPVHLLLDHQYRA